ncbi:MAG: hypothetical protein V8Q45_11935 [Alistipes onderdonkii]
MSTVKATTTCGESSDAGICFSIANFSVSPISLAMKRLASAPWKRGGWVCCAAAPHHRASAANKIAVRFICPSF